MYILVHFSASSVFACAKNSQGVEPAASVPLKNCTSVSDFELRVLPCGKTSLDMEQLEIYGIVVFFSVANVLFFVYNITDD